MIEPENDEERKALRLENLSNGTEFSEFAHSDSRNHWVKILQSARAILREEQEANDKTTHAEWGKTEHERYVDILEQWKVQRAEIERLQAIVRGKDELAAIREEITLRARVLRVFNVSLAGETISPGARQLRDDQFQRFVSLLTRERELMGDGWQT